MSRVMPLSGFPPPHVESAWRWHFGTRCGVPGHLKAGTEPRVYEGAALPGRGRVQSPAPTSLGADLRPILRIKGGIAAANPYGMVLGLGSLVFRIPSTHNPRPSTIHYDAGAMTQCAFVTEDHHD